MKSESAPNRQRNDAIDVFKGLTALFMVLAHVIYFAKTGDQAFFSQALVFINLTTFTTLLFLSGIGCYLAYLRTDISAQEFSAKKNKLITKFVKLVFCFYLIALVGNLPALLDQSIDPITQLIEIVVLIDLPTYAEFLITFMFFYLLIYFLRPLIKKITNNFILVVIVSVLCYLLGMYIYQMQIPSQLLSLKSIIAGNSDWYRFPILQYVPVFLIGAYFGKLIAYQDQQLENRLKKILTIFFVVLAIISFGLKLAWQQNPLEMRWPPDYSFLIIGVTYAMLMIFIIEKVVSKFKFKMLDYVGKNLFDFYLVHIILLYVVKYALGEMHLSGAEAVLYYLIIVLLCFVIVFITNSHKFLNPIREKLKLRSFDSVYFRIFYIVIVIWLAGLLTYRLLVNYNPEAGVVISENFVDASYNEQVVSNITLETKIDRHKIFRIESDDPSYDLYKSAIFDISVNNKNFFYKGVDIMIDGKEVQRLDTNEVHQYNFKVNPEAFSVGTHTLQARVTGSDLLSEATEFVVSYPLFVTWTIDWEGYDISDANMKAMTTISSKYGVPMVQLVNPRTFIASDISKARKEIIKKYVLDRYAAGDEIGLHMHMHYDLFKACGLEYRTTPKWGARENGHDVPTNAYTAEEFGALVDCALQDFKELGFPKPVSYRAGGWFIDLKNLKVLPEKGLKIDTSGREYYVWGALTGPWNLPADTHPYMMSNTDQNKGSETDNFGLIEIPNNGSDSTNNTLKTMQEKFDKNLPNPEKPLEEMQVVTFMSHAHWVTQIDGKTIDALMKNVSKYNAKNDQGPVIFTTLDRIYNLHN